MYAITLYMYIYGLYASTLSVQALHLIMVLSKNLHIASFSVLQVYSYTFLVNPYVSKTQSMYSTTC